MRALDVEALWSLLDVEHIDVPGEKHVLIPQREGKKLCLQDFPRLSPVCLHLTGTDLCLLQ